MVGVILHSAVLVKEARKYADVHYHNDMLNIFLHAVYAHNVHTKANALITQLPSFMELINCYL